MPKPKVFCLLRHVLEDKRLTAADLARGASLDPGHLSRIIKGARNPRVTAARRISQFLGVPIEVLWPESEPRRRK